MLNRGLDKQELLRIVEAVANEKSIDKELVIGSMESANADELLKLKYRIDTPLYVYYIRFSEFVQDFNVLSINWLQNWFVSLSKIDKLLIFNKLDIQFTSWFKQFVEQGWLEEPVFGEPFGYGHRTV